jgi:hypothetical protein
MTGDRDPIYVQIDIAGPIERVWELTQTPNLHQQWDLRFTEINYLPRPDPELPQRFQYITRIGFGLRIVGAGESVGSHDASNGQRTSALKFWSDDSKSLIRKGSGYWKYIPSADESKSVRFLTGYDYEVRFGAAGRWFDRLVFRSLMGWATAWSFERLRLWIEKGIDPAASMRNSLIYFAARITVAMIWLYQGAAPKLIFREPGEVAMILDAGFSNAVALWLRTGLGLTEIAGGAIVIIFWRARWPLWCTVVAMFAATADVLLNSPQWMITPFNAATLNLSMLALAVIALLAAQDLPSARHCVRRPSGAKL